jgi:hypothetical protein
LAVLLAVAVIAVAFRLVEWFFERLGRRLNKTDPSSRDKPS